MSTKVATAAVPGYKPDDQIHPTYHQEFVSLLWTAREWMYEKASDAEMLEAINALDRFIYPKNLDPTPESIINLHQFPVMR